MAHPGHPVISSAQEQTSVSRERLNEAFYTVDHIEKTTDFDALYTEATHYRIDASGGAVTASLPDPASASGQRFSFLRVDAATFAVTISSYGATGTGNINGASSFSLSSQWEGATFYNDGTDWFQQK